MEPIWLVAGARLRRNLRSSALIGALLAVTVAVVLAAVAGARRTDTVVGQLVAADRGADGYAAFTLPFAGGTADPDLKTQEAAIKAFPGVSGTARFADVLAELSGPTVPAGRLAVGGWIGMEPGAITKVSTLPLVRGRTMDERHADEIVIDEELARDTALEVGSEVDLRLYSGAQRSADANTPAAGWTERVKVVGIVRRPIDLRDPDTAVFRANDYTVHHDIYLSSAHWRAAGGDIADFNPMVAFDVAGGTDLPALLAEMTKRTGAYSIDHDRFLELRGTFKGVTRSASLHARGLDVFALVLGLAGLYLVGQTLGRQIESESSDDAFLRVIGMTGGQLRLAVLIRAFPVAAAGSLLGLFGAIALSPLAPLPGTVARRAALHPGVSVDLPVLVVGAVVAIFLAVLAAALPTLRRPPTVVAERGAWRSPLGPRGAGWLISSASRFLRAPAAVGVRFALEPGRRRDAVPVRSAIATAASALSIVLVAQIFSASLADSRRNPSRYGVAWDVAAGAMTSPDDARVLAERVRALPDITAFAGMATTAFDTPYGEIPSVMVQQQLGTVTPLVTEGRAPGKGEVALGALTMHETGLRIGDELTINDAIAGSFAFRITGTVVLNVAGVDVSIPPGRGALFDWSMMAILNAKSAEFIGPQIFLVDAAPGKTASVESALRSIFPTSTSAVSVEPLDLTNLADAGLLPQALGAVTAILGIGTVAHAMISAVRRRKSDIAVLRAFGFVRSDVRSVIVWQGLTFVAVCTAIGIPAGVIAGRAAWSLATDRLGIVNVPVVPLGMVLAAPLICALIVLVTALIPAAMATRIPVATVLRRI